MNLQYGLKMSEDRKSTFGASDELNVCVMLQIILMPQFHKLKICLTWLPLKVFPHLDLATLSKQLVR